MIRKLLLLSALLSLLVSHAANAVGFSRLNVADGEQPALTVAVWYPSDTPPSEQSNNRFGQRLAMEGTVSGQSLPLLLISHGYGGWHGSHANTAMALAEQGFVVAALTHAGNNYQDLSAPVERWVLERPRHISVVIDYFQRHWPQRSHLDTDAIGVYGFSAGGYTTLALAGAVPDLAIAQEHCLAHPEEYVCQEGMLQRLLDNNLQTLAEEAWGRDKRIKAAAAAAPGFGFAFGKDSLKNVQIPIQLWSAVEDQSVSHQYNALTLAERLSNTPETHWIEHANHFAFLLTPCRPKLKKYEPDTWQKICVDKPEFDRRAFHQHMNQQLADFFQRTLK